MSPQMLQDDQNLVNNMVFVNPRDLRANKKIE